MRILVDTNVILDVLLDREPFSNVATQLLEKVENGILVGYLSATTITTIYYLTAKSIGREKAQIEISKLLSLFEVAPINRTVIEMAIRSKVSDFEDAVLCEAARHVGADGIVTRNIKDFKQADVNIYSPAELIKLKEPKPNS